MRFRSLRSLWLLIWPPSNCIDRENLWPPILISISCCLKQLSTLDSRWSCMWVLLELQAVQVCGCMPLSSVEILVPLSTLERTQSIYTDQSADTYFHWLLVGSFISRCPLHAISISCCLTTMPSSFRSLSVDVYCTRCWWSLRGCLDLSWRMVTDGMSWYLPFSSFFFSMVNVTWFGGCDQPANGSGHACTRLNN